MSSHHELLHVGLPWIFGGLFWLWVSGSMIAHMWMEHRRDPLLKKLGWMLVLCVPFFGWLFYLGMYTPLRPNDVRCSPRYY